MHTDHSQISLTDNPICQLFRVTTQVRQNSSWSLRVFFLFPNTLLTRTHPVICLLLFFFSTEFLLFQYYACFHSNDFFYTSAFRPFPGENCVTLQTPEALSGILIKDNIRCWANVRSTSTAWRWDYWNCLADILHLYGQPKVVCNMCPYRHLHVYEFSDPLVNQTYTWLDMCRQKYKYPKVNIHLQCVPNCASVDGSVFRGGW